ncbi:MAG TPA: helicase HerA-like domain-containing protein [Hyphomicrobiaceae bacterium]|nr:helicase HerA-like domain-containing protein [Hyphomicrobiaceae bacterium]
MPDTPDSSPAESPHADPRDYVQDGAVLIGCSRQGQDVVPEVIELRLANRHGLVTGATGTGKTVTLQVLAEGFSAAGVPVFAADIKGDLSGLGVKGEPKPNLVQRAEEIGLARYGNAAFPVAFWDVLGEQGHPVRATVQEMGPLLLSRLLELTEPQEGVLNIAFKWAEDERKAGDHNMEIVDLRDLRGVIDEMGKKASTLRSKYGNIAPATVGVIQRSLLVLEQQGAEKFFGEPALDIDDFIRTGPDGRGVINILAAEKLMNTPRLYATFLLWLLSELFDKLPEVGDLDKPKLVFLFDEAHLLFNGARSAVLDQIERVTRLIRSKGVGVFYVTQSPGDVPDRISAQLGNRIQHALRAFTPKEQKAVRAAAQTFRKNPDLDTERAIQELQVGEALVSVLHNKGEPSIVQRTLVRPPMSRVGPLTPEERKALIEADTANWKKYRQVLDRESAHERLRARNSTVGQVKDKLRRFGNLFNLNR